MNLAETLIMAIAKDTDFLKQHARTIVITPNPPKIIAVYK